MIFCISPYEPDQDIFIRCMTKRTDRSEKVKN